MLRVKGVMFLICGFILVLISGCATMGRKPGLESQGLKNQIRVLETRLKEKDQEIYDLKEALNKASAEKEVAVKSFSIEKADLKIKIRPTPKAIQTALKNANFYNGNIDGKIGKNTVEAIKNFQKANNLHADGKVGKKTWELLKAHVN
ncbi:MAG: peptidoglycan-binding protein [Candidatus Omnitrophota bacterium]